MDLDSFLLLEKKRIAEERQRLYEQSIELNSPVNEKTSSITHDNKNGLPHAIEDDNICKKTKDWINEQYNRKTNNHPETLSKIKQQQKHEVSRSNLR